MICILFFVNAPSTTKGCLRWTRLCWFFSPQWTNTVVTHTNTLKTNTRIHTLNVYTLRTLPSPNVHKYFVQKGYRRQKKEKKNKLQIEGFVLRLSADYEYIVGVYIYIYICVCNPFCQHECFCPYTNLVKLAREEGVSRKFGVSPSRLVVFSFACLSIYYILWNVERELLFFSLCTDRSWVVRAKHGLGRENTEAAGMRQGSRTTDTWRRASYIRAVVDPRQSSLTDPTNPIWKSTGPFRIKTALNFNLFRTSIWSLPFNKRDFEKGFVLLKQKRMPERNDEWNGRKVQSDINRNIREAGWLNWPNVGFKIQRPWGSNPR